MSTDHFASPIGLSGWPFKNPSAEYVRSPLRTWNAQAQSMKAITVLTSASLIRTVWPVDAERMTAAYACGPIARQNMSTVNSSIAIPGPCLTTLHNDRPWAPVALAKKKIGKREVDNSRGSVCEGRKIRNFVNVAWRMG